MNKRELKKRKYKKGYTHSVVAYPLANYVEGIIHNERWGTKGWRGFYSCRKPWKIVQPPWLEYVVAHAGIELVYDKPVEPVRWEAHWCPDEDGVKMCYRFRELQVAVLASTSWRLRLNAYDHDLIMRRKDWKVMTRAHAECVVRNFGGELV